MREGRGTRLHQRADPRYGLALDALAAGDPAAAEPHLAAAARRYTEIDYL